MKSTYCFLFLALISININGQANFKFDWVNSDTLESSRTVQECNGLAVTLGTSIPHQVNTSSSFPLTSATMAVMNSIKNYTVTISFSQPVSNVRLHISDIDRTPRDLNSIPIVGSTAHGEKIINLLPFMPSADNSLQVVGNEIHANADNSEGWLSWNGTNINAISFQVQRLNDRYGIMLDEIEFDCSSYDLPICCSPMNQELMKDLFDHIPSGPITSPYKLDFNSNPYFASLFQAYLEYVKLIGPSIQKLVSHWRLIDAGTGVTPNNVYSPMIEETYSWFEPGGNENIYGNANFFSNSLNINQWYKIHTGIYTEPTNVLTECKAALYFFYRVQISNGRLIGTISDGTNVLKRIDFGEGKTVIKKKRN